MNKDREQNLLNYTKTIELFDISNHGSDIGEWHYIQGHFDSTKNVLYDILNSGIMPDRLDICDCGVGFGTILFDLYLQSLDIPNVQFSFTGIEKNNQYNDFTKKNLLSLWNGNLRLIEGDIMEVDYSNWNFVYFYQPFSKSDLAMKFYHKVIHEAKNGTFIFGIDHFNIMTYGSQDLIGDFKKLKYHKFENCFLFQKI